MENLVMPSESFWKNRRVLLTGHTGFKGSWLLLWLQQLGAQVFSYSLAPESGPNLFTDLVSEGLPGNSWVHHIGDLADLHSLEAVVHRSQPEVVLHLAAQPLVRRGYEDPIGTWSTNVMGTLNLLEALRQIQHPCAVVIVTTDKVYENQEWNYGYREEDRLGGLDPYSASKAGAEIAISSWRSSFCGHSPHQNANLRIATARAGNVIGGGDWAYNRIVPDAIRGLSQNQSIAVRNPRSTRPWQHVLEPLSGYLRLAEALVTDSSFPCEAFNFGPNQSSNRSVADLVDSILAHWPGQWFDRSNSTAPHEASLLHLQTDKAYFLLGWEPRWNFATTVGRTVSWYRSVHEGASPLQCCLSDLSAYIKLL